MLTIFCAIVGEARSVVEVEIDDADSVSALLKDIKAMFLNALKDAEAARMELFLAKKDGKWMQSCSEEMKKLRKGEKTAAIEELIHEDKELDPMKKLGGLFDDAPTDDVLHVLVVVVPYAVKRQRREVKTSIEELWELSKLQLETLPAPHQIKAPLERPLPFRLTLRDPVVPKDIFDPNAPLFSCPELETSMNYFICQSQRKFHPETKASEGSWQKYYDILLSLTTNLYLEKGYAVLTRRNPADTAETTLPPVRPNYILQRNCVVLLGGEEQSSVVSIAISVGKLLQKMRGWSVILYADLPHILGYATSGSDIQFIAIEKSDGRCNSTPILRWDI
ncbi:hypothetical protein V7S43_001813 [Phytophthora oleae]|uniref:Crinkler effector protein N-terminal domain-containing protein n=1 Tax=Phytophthora oleae TaxID=2107226 RepID=A0ABD3G034_9STRA